MKASRICVVVDSLYAGGGADLSTVRMAEALPRDRFDVELVVTGAPAQNEIETDLPVTRLHVKHLRTAIIRLATYFARTRPDLIYAVKAHVNLVVLLSAMHARLRVPVVVCEQIHFPSFLRHEKRRSVFRAAGFWMASALLYRRAYRVVCVSEGARQALINTLRLPSSRVIHLPNLVIGADFRQRIAAGPAHPWLCDGGSPVVVSVSRLSPQKDFPTLLRAFATISDEMNPRLLIVGEGPLHEELEALAHELGIASRVDFTGFQRNPLAYVAHADLFVLASKWEGLAMVLIEALGAGIPVVSSDCPVGPSEYIRPGINGLLVPVGNVPTLAAAMEELLRDQGRLEAMRAAAPASVARFRVENVACSYAAFFDEVLSGFTSGRGGVQWPLTATLPRETTT